MSSAQAGAELSPGHPRTRTDSFGRQLVLVLVVCVLAFWVRLGADGLSDTEGHRAIPGWEMLASGDWLVPTLFDQAYLRKPPGMTWAVAFSSMVFGETEIAARAVSALASTLMAVLAFVFARRWFGSRYAASAGIAFALTPWFWQAGRAAEIEALNNLFIQTAVLLIVDRVVFASRNVKRDLLSGLLAGVAMGAALLTKGPICLVIVGAVIAASGVACRSKRLLVHPTAWLALAVGFVCFGAWYLLVHQRIESAGLEPVMQSVGGFLWELDRLGSVFLLVPAAIVSALPLSVALIFPFGARARQKRNDADDKALQVVRTLSLGCLFSLMVLMIAGVGNTRYTTPAFVFVSPAVVYFMQGWAGGFSDGRRAMANLLLLGHPLRSMGVMLVALGVWVLAIEPQRDARSGRRAGQALADDLPDGTIILSDHLIEARPEVLWYAMREAQRNDKTVTARWVPGLAGQPLELGDHELLLLRTDQDEADRLKEQFPELREFATGEVHEYTFGLFGR